MLESSEDDVPGSCDFERPARVRRVHREHAFTQFDRRGPGERGADGDLPRQRGAGGRGWLTADDLREHAGAEMLDRNHRIRV